MMEEGKSKRMYTMSGRLRNRGWKRRIQFLRIMKRFKRYVR